MSALIEEPQGPVGTKGTSVEQELYADAGRFDFYQAVTLLRKSEAIDTSADRSKSKNVRFETPASTAFPASSIDSIRPATVEDPAARVTVNFMGLTGPSGVLPRHYTEQVIRLERQLRGTAKRTLRAWYDLFNNCFVGQMFRAWSDRRIDRGVASREADRPEADAFTNSLHSLIGLGSSALRNRLEVADGDGEAVDRVRDLSLLRHAGTLARRQRSAAQIGAVLSTHFGVAIRVEQFRGQWLALEAGDRTRLGGNGQANQLGVDATAGSRVWDVQSRIRVRVGPLNHEQFQQFLPDTVSGTRRRRYVMLCQLTRLLVGAELDFDVQLILRQQDIKPLGLVGLVGRDGSQRLGWGSWLATKPLGRDGDDPVFEPIESTALSNA